MKRLLPFGPFVALLFVPVGALGHGIIVNVDLNAAGTKLVTDRTVYADRDITAITAIDQSLSYEMDDDVPGFNFSSGVLSQGGVISLKVISPMHFWNPTSQLQATTSASVVLDSLFYFSPPAGGAGPIGESVAGQTTISSTLPVGLYDPSAPPATDHHYAAYDLTTGAAQTDPPVGAYGLMVELVNTTAGGTIASNPFVIGLDNGLTHSVSSFGAAGNGDHQQPSADGTQYGAAVAAFEEQLANTAVWNFNGGGNYSAAANWDGNPLQGSGNAGMTITLSNGSTTAITVASAIVTVDGAYTAGALVFDNLGGTNYTLAGDGVTGHGMTLNANSAGASVNVLGGSHTISANLTLAERTVFNVASGASLIITGGQINESSIGTSVLLTGGGTLTIDSASAYTGPTTINGGLLQTTNRGSIGSGPLALNTDNYIISMVHLANSQTVGGLSVTGDGSGSATVAVASGQTLTVEQPANLATSTTLQVTGGGKFRFAATSGSAMIGTGAAVTVAPAATLELAGSVSALGTPGGNRVHIVNDSTASGVVVSGTNQVVGDIDGSGIMQVNAGSDLTANHIVQSALIIGGAAGNTAFVTIDASDASGNPLGQSSGLILAGLQTPGDPFGASGISSANLGSGGSELTALSPGSSIGGGQPVSVPEPSTLLLVLLAITSLIGQRIAIRHRARRTDV